jgi:tyrosyl-tRNA synthetase
MSGTYDLRILKQALLWNVEEVLPSDTNQLEEELKVLVDQANQSGQPIRHYIGFEISGQIHIGTGIASALKIKKLQDAGVRCSIFLADYHTWLNNKLDGNLDTIRTVARQYFGPVMLKCCQVCGVDVDQIDLILAEDLYQKSVHGRSFWTVDMKVGKELTLSRVLKSVSITGKEAGEAVEFGTLRYPVMQVADAFFMQTHIVQAGMDQRKCHVLMREVAPKLKDGFELKIGQAKVKPIAVHTKLLHGLETPKLVQEKAVDLKVWKEIDKDLGGEVDWSEEKLNQPRYEISKMSKSRPDSAVWVHDSVQEIERKLKKAYCPMPSAEQSDQEKENEQATNPMLNWAENMIYPGGKIIEIHRPEKFGGDKVYNTFEELKADYLAGKLHPMDLKSGVAKCLGQWFAPIREFVENNPGTLELVKRTGK